MATHNNTVELSTFRSWFVVLSSALFFFYIFIQMNLFNAINSELTRELQFNAEQLGHFLAAYSLGNAVFLFPAGILLDRFSVRKILLTVFCISIVATYLFSISNEFEKMYVLRFVIGLAGAFTLLSAIKLASRWFEPKHMALVVGVVVTMAMLGGIVAQTPLILLTQKVGWRIAMQLIAGLGILLVLLQIVAVKDEPKRLEKVGAGEHHKLEKAGFWHSLGLVLATKQNWLSGLYISLINLPLFILGGMWGVPYLTQVHNFSSVEAATIISMMFVGMTIGSPLVGLISDYLGLRKLPMIIGAILSIMAMLIVMFAPTMPFMAEIILYLVLGFFLSSQVIGYPVIAESNHHSITATATGLGSVLIMSAGMLTPIFGALLENSGGAQVVDNVKVYTKADFISANYMLLIGLIIALFASLLIKETYCKQLDKLDKGGHVI